VTRRPQIFVQHVLHDRVRANRNHGRICGHVKLAGHLDVGGLRQSSNSYCNSHCGDHAMCCLAHLTIHRYARAASIGQVAITSSPRTT
jgi:hypothetical protein